MKRLSSFIILGFVLSMSCPAQQPEPITVFPWCEDFELGEAPEWTFIDNDGDNMNWIVADYNPDGTGYSLFGPSYLQGRQDNWAISPALSLPNDCSSIRLEWRIRSLANYNETYDILVSSGQSNDLVSYDSLFSETFSDGYYSRHLDISNFRGMTVHIAFRHRSQFQNYMCVDNVCVRTDNIVHDSISVAINAPSSAFVGEDVFLEAVSNNADSFFWTIDSAIVNTLESPRVVARWEKPGCYHFSVRALNEWNEAIASGEITITKKPSESIFTTEDISHDVTIYPNPAANNIVVNMPYEASIEIIDFCGKTLKTGKSSSKMDISELPAGVYFLRASSSNGVIVKKLVVTHN